MELDNTDKRILFELDLNARLPETELARRIRKSREVVRYRIRHLTESGAIKGYFTWINVSKLGYRGYKMYLKVRGSKEQQKAFFDHIRSRKDIFWLGIADGAWDVGLTFFAKSDSEFFATKNELFSRFSDVLLEKVTGSLVDAIAMPKKMLGFDSPRVALVFGDPAHNRIDETERRILGELFHNARIRLVDLSRNTSNTIEVVRNRIRKLEQMGIITRYNATLDYTKLGFEFYKTFLYFDDLSAEKEKLLAGFCRTHPNIVNTVRLIAPWDYELEIMVENYAQYNAIMHQLRSLFPHELRNIESAIMSEDYVFPAKKTIFD